MNSMRISDATIVQPELNRQLLDCRDALLGFVLALTRDMDAAEEVVQEVSLAVLREAERGVVPENFFAWVLGLARHRVADYYRACMRDRKLLEKLAELADAASAAFIAQPPKELDERELRFLRQCMNQIRGRARKILDGRYMRSLSIREIAAELAWTPRSVSVALSRVRNTLAQCVQRKLKLEASHE